MTDDLDRVRASYDTVTDSYVAEIATELERKPLDRALLAGFADLVTSAALGLPVADLGCGPGHVTAYLAARGLPMIGIDLSPAMVAAARRRHPDLSFEIGSMTALDVPDGAWAGAVAAYSIIHLAPAQRAATYRELARTIRSGGWVLVSFHVAHAEHPTGDVLHLAEWWGHAVDLDAYFLDPAEVIAGLAEVGFALHARVDREPIPGAEYPSRRAYLFLTRD